VHTPRPPPAPRPRRLDRLLASAAFRDRASRLPVGRWVARRRAGQLFELASGVVQAQVLQAVVRLDLPLMLLEAPQSPAELSRRLDLPEDSVLRLCEAARALGLLSRRAGGRYGPGGLGLALCNNDGLLAMLAHHDCIYDDLRDPVALLEAGIGAGLSRYWSYAGGGGREAPDGESVAGYTALMGRSQALIAGAVLDAYPMRRHRRVLDLGGGDGTFLLAALDRWPHLQAVSFDLPAVVEAARERLARRPPERRLELVGGDWRCDPIPPGPDLVTLVRVLHDHEDDVVRDLLARLRSTMRPGGRLLVAEPMAQRRGRSAKDAYFHMYFLGMGQGRLRTPAQVRRLLREAGWRGAQMRPTAIPLLAQVVVALA